MTTFVVELWDLLCMMAPYLLFGFFLAGVLSVVFSAEFVEKQLGRKGIGSILKATLLGIPLPLCSCGVLPVTASIRERGASKGAVVSFLTSTPQTGADSIFVTYSMLGPVFAIFRPVAAFLAGLLAGLSVECVAHSDEDDTKPETDNPESQQPPKQQDSCCSSESQPHEGVVYRIFHYGFVVLLGDIAGSLLLGLVIATVITMFVPDNWFSYFGGNSLLSMLMAMLVGVPLYVCSTASVPMALAMMTKGLSAGAALVFLMTGTATNAAALVTIRKIIGLKATVIYLVSILLAAIGCGILLNNIYSYVPKAYTMLHEHESISMLARVAGVILLGLLLYAIIKPLLSKRHGHSSDTAGVCRHDHPTLLLAIDGMNCQHCVGKISDVLNQQSFIDTFSLDLKTKRASLALNDDKEADEERLLSQLDAAGFKAEIVKEG